MTWTRLITLGAVAATGLVALTACMDNMAAAPTGTATNASATVPMTPASAAEQPGAVAGTGDPYGPATPAPATAPAVPSTTSSVGGR